MNNTLKNKQSCKYKKDIANIYSEINNHLPHLKSWQLNQSVIFEENKKILCKAITNEKKEKIGNTVIISFTENSPYSYELTMLENRLSFVKSYFQDNDAIREKTDIFLDENYINRSCNYKVNEIELNYEERYNLKDDTTEIITNVPGLDKEEFGEIKEALEEMKSIFKISANKKIKHL